MKAVAVIAQKGGAGKTTLTLNLALAAELNGQSTVIIDLDPQASAASWGDSRNGIAPVAVSAQHSRLDQIMAVAKANGAELAIIDTAPHSETASLAAARASDLVMIPCRPGVLDIRAIKNSIEIAKLAKTPALVVLNACPPQGSLVAEAAVAVQDYDVEVAPFHIVQRAVFGHSITAGQGVLEYEPESKAAHEITQLFQYISGKVELQS